MDFWVAVIKVVVGTFALFTVASVTYAGLGQRSGWGWVILVGALAVVNMVVHRLLGSSINPPFFTAVWFGILLIGLTPKASPTVAPWYRRGVYAVVVGTVIGWASYAEVSPAQ